MSLEETTTGQTYPDSAGSDRLSRLAVSCLKNAGIPLKPPCACNECGDWLDENDLYRMDGLTRPVCLACYEAIHNPNNRIDG